MKGASALCCVLAGSSITPDVPDAFLAERELTAFVWLVKMYMSCELVHSKLGRMEAMFCSDDSPSPAEKQGCLTSVASSAEEIT